MIYISVGGLWAERFSKYVWRPHKGFFNIPYSNFPPVSPATFDMVLCLNNMISMTYTRSKELGIGRMVGKYSKILVEPQVGWRFPILIHCTSYLLASVLN